MVDVAYAAGIAEGAIRQMEGGQTKGASLVVGLRLAKIPGVTPDYLVTGVDGSANDTGMLRMGWLAWTTTNGGLPRSSNGSSWRAR